MPPRRSAGILVHRRRNGVLQVLVGHMGGPFWGHKDTGAWSIPKGELDPGEDPVAAARREFAEELGLAVPPGELVELGEVTQRNGKIVTVWALAADLDLTGAVYGTFEMEWPHGSGQLRQFPEIDRAEWLDVDVAYGKVLSSQRAFLDRLRTLTGN